MYKRVYSRDTNSFHQDIEVVLTFNGSIKVGWSLFSLCGKTEINILLMHRVLDGDTIKTWNTAPFVCGKTWLCFRRRLGGSMFHTFSTSWKRLVDSRLLLLFHDVVLAGCEQHSPTTARAGCCKRTSFRCRCPLARACNIIIFVRFSVEILTLWVPFFPTIVHLAAKNGSSVKWIDISY